MKQPHIYRSDEATLAGKKTCLRCGRLEGQSTWCYGRVRLTPEQMISLHANAYFLERHKDAIVSLMTAFSEQETEEKAQLLQYLRLAVCEPKEAVKGNVPSDAEAVEMAIDIIVKERKTLPEIDLGPCTCSKTPNETKCKRHGHQRGGRELCPECKEHYLGYCIEGEYCTSDTCHYAY